MRVVSLARLAAAATSNGRRCERARRDERRREEARRHRHGLPRQTSRDGESVSGRVTLLAS